MVTASLKLFGLVFMLVNCFCKGEARLCSVRIEEMEHRLLEAMINQTKAMSKTQCPDTWTIFQGSCYLFSKTKANFHDAEIFCSGQGAHLVYVESEWESTFLKGHMRELKSSNYWMGLTDADNEGVFLWYDTDVPNLFADWAPGEPTNSGGKEHCTHFSVEFNYAWNDANCGALDKFVCEKELS